MLAWAFERPLRAPYMSIKQRKGMGHARRGAGCEWMERCGSAGGAEQRGAFRRVGKTLINLSGGDACGGHTRSHPEHDGEDPCGRWYYAGDGMGEQAAARHFLEKALSGGRTFFMPA